MAASGAIEAGKAFVRIGSTDSDLVRGLRKAQARLAAFGNRVQTLGVGLAKASAAGILPLAASARVFGTFEQRMARVRALTGANGKEFAALGDRARELGASTVFSASQAAEAMGVFALAGYEVDQILASVGPTLKLAAAGELEIAQAADIAAKIMSGMGIEADSLANTVDVLTKAMTTANTDLTELGAAMKFVGPVAKSAGIGLEETVAAIQALSNAGIGGEMAGTSIRGILLALTSPSAEARDELKRLGVTVSDTAGNVRPLAEIVGDLESALARVGSAERLDALGKIFSARQVAGAAELIDVGGAKLKQMTESLEDAGGTAERIAKTQLNTLNGAVTILKSSIEGLAITIGDAISGPARIVIGLVTKAAGRITDWAKANRLLLVGIGAGAAILGVMAGGLVAVALGAKALAFILGGLASVLVAAKVAFAVMAAAIGFLATPIGAAIAILSGLATAAVLYTGLASRALFYLGQQWARLTGFAKKALDGIRDAIVAGDVELATEILWLGIKVIWQKGATTLRKIWLELRSFFVTTVYKMWYGALAALETVLYAIEVAWIETTAFLSKTWTRITSALSKTWAHFAAGFQESWGSAINWTTKKFIELQGLFDDGLDVDAAKRIADEGLAEQNAEIERRHANEVDRIDKQRETTLNSREAQRDAERKASRELHETTLAVIGKQFDDAKNDLDEATKAQIAETEAKLKAAQDKFDQAVNKARKDRAEIDRGVDREKTGGVVEELKKALNNVGTAAGRISTAGTFNPAVVGRLGGQTIAEKTLRATERTAENTGRLVNRSLVNRNTFT